MDYLIERLSSQNIHHLVSLYRSAFHQSILLSVLIKKYDTKAFGIEYIGFIALTPQGNAAAYYGVIPCAFLLNGKTVLAAQSADTMTHPDHRKKGLFQRLANKTYELASVEGIEFVFGFPNQDSFPGFVKLGWQFNQDQLQLFSMKAGKLSYARLLKKSRLTYSIYNVLLRRIFGNDHPTESFFETKPYGLKHDDKFCAYKTYNPTSIVSFHNVKAWVKADGKLKVGAVRGLTKENASDFLSHLRSVASRLGCGDVVFITSKHSTLYDVLKELLKPQDAFPIGYFPLDNELASFDKVIFEYCDVDIF